MRTLHVAIANKTKKARKLSSHTPNNYQDAKILSHTQKKKKRKRKKNYKCYSTIIITVIISTNTNTHRI